jgi:alkylhydroperoxidase family enzyme
MANGTANPRIEPLAPPYEPGVADMLKRWMPPGAAIEPLRLFRTLGVHDELAARMRPLGAGILGHGRIEPRDREIVIHRTCARAGAEYEWGVHAIAYGRPVGLTEDQIAATAGVPDDAGWSEQDTLLIRLADELHDTCDVSDALWTSLAERFREDQLLELVIVAGWYRLLSYVINAARVQHEPWATRFPRSSTAGRDPVTLD